MSENKAGTEIAKKPHPLLAFSNKYFSCKKTTIFKTFSRGNLFLKKQGSPNSRRKETARMLLLVCFVVKNTPQAFQP